MNNIDAPPLDTLLADSLIGSTTKSRKNKDV